jgi:hypothetical protein
MNLLRDLLYGVRILRHNRGFAIAAVAVVALGIGATTAVFSVIRGVLLQPLAYRDPERLVLFRADLPGYRRDPLLNPEELVALQLALVLTAVGVYRSVAYVTARRTREIAVRRALGARGARIVALVVRKTACWGVAELAAGLAGAFALSRYLESLLFGVGARDSMTFLGVSVLLAAVAVAATVIPALRANRVDPMLALRSE